MLGPAAANTYFEVVNKEGVALPTALQPARDEVRASVIDSRRFVETLE